MAAIVKDLNKGSVVKTMLVFSIPLLGASLIQMLYNTADMVIVGRFVGKNGLGAVSVGGDVLHFLCFVAMGFSNAGQVIISQYLGAGMKDKIGRIIGTLFFIFMVFAAYSTVIAVFENIISFWLEMTNLKRPVICAINIGLLMVLSLPAIFSLGIWDKITVMGMGFLDLEDFIVSNVLLPVGSLVYVVFCTSRYGWGWRSFDEEVNCGSGLKLPKWIRPYMSYVLPVIILGLMVYSIVSKFI